MHKQAQPNINSLWSAPHKNNQIPRLLQDDLHKSRVQLGVSGGEIFVRKILFCRLVLKLAKKIFAQSGSFLAFCVVPNTFCL